MEVLINADAHGEIQFYASLKQRHSSGREISNHYQQDSHPCNITPSLTATGHHPTSLYPLVGKVNLLFLPTSSSLFIAMPATDDGDDRADKLVPVTTDQSN